VVITQYREDGVYIAEIEVTNQDGNAIRISARPCDAVALVSTGRIRIPRSS
jgi:bifunctional DNase/RNase